MLYIRIYVPNLTTYVFSSRWLKQSLEVETMIFLFNTGQSLLKMMNNLGKLLLLSVVFSFLWTPFISALETAETTASKLEQLKEDVLQINRDLFILEEDLLFPGSTQLAAYLSVDIGYFFALDNIKIKIDDEQVTHHLYTEKDVDALYRGAIQKVYLGNISTGKHRLDAIIIGIGPNKREYRRAVSFEFEKDSEAKALEIQLKDDTGKLQPSLKVIEW